MIHKIQLLQQALATLRVQREPVRSNAREPVAPGQRWNAPTGRGGSLDEQIRRRIATIDREDPRRRRRILRATLELCLSAEWGDEMAADPGFQSLVDRVLEHIENDPSFQPLVDDALTSLISPSS